VSDEKLWDESPTSRHLQVLYHQTSFHVDISISELSAESSYTFFIQTLHECDFPTTKACLISGARQLHARIHA